MINVIPPALIFIVGAFLVPLFRGKVKSVYLLLLPVISFINLIYISYGAHGAINFLDYQIIFCRIDRLSLVFGYIFHIIAFLTILYGINMKNNNEYMAGLFYAGCAIGVTFSGDLISLFCFWEMMTIGSVLLIWARKTKKSFDAGFRYALVHFFGGVILLVGIILYSYENGSIKFGDIGLDGLGSYLIFFGFILNAAVPPFSAWLSDAYPEATVTGAVFLSAFTTKTAVYVLIRAFSGTEILIWLGAIMAFYGVIFAVLANDIRRLLAYHIISQVGYMVAGVGIGTALALNGSVAHAFSHILYKGVLFMGAGAVLHMTGKSKLSELGGLYKTMPITLTLYMIGGFSISAFPLFSGFVSKSMIVTAAAEKHLTLIWLILSISSAGTFLHTGLKLPYFTFFAKDSGIRAKEPPLNMLIAMGIASSLCILIGVYPDVLYNLLPFAASYVPYTAEHVVWTMQILLFTALGFFMLLKHLGGEPYITLDTDWLYRKGAAGFLWLLDNPLAWFGNQVKTTFFVTIPQSLTWSSRNPLMALKMAGNNIVLTLFEESFTKEKVERIRKRIREEMSVYPGSVISYSEVGITIVWVMGLLLGYLIVSFVCGIIAV